MTPIEFPEHNIVLAKDQPQYQPLPVFNDGEQMISCWQLTAWERLRLLFTGKLWLRQLTFGGPLQPQLPQVERPFAPPPATERPYRGLGNY